jgi:hypothetical protein
MRLQTLCRISRVRWGLKTRTLVSNGERLNNSAKPKQKRRQSAFGRSRQIVSLAWTVNYRDLKKPS